MLDPLIELHILLGVVFWLGCHQLLQCYWTGHDRQRLGQRGGNKPRYPPLPGLLEKPHCERCAVVAEAQPERVPPPVLCSSRGRPRQVNTAAHYCPNPKCAYYGWLKRGNIRANGRPNGRAWRQLYCRACGQYFLEAHGTLFYGKQHAPETILQAIGCLAAWLKVWGFEPRHGCLPSKPKPYWDG